MQFIGRLMLASIILLGLGGAAPKPEVPAKPNIVLIIWDSVRRDHLGVYGYKEPTTPNLDQFAQKARIYDHANTPTPWTLPAHAAMFTGLYQHETQTNWDHQWLDDRFQTLAEFLRPAGYDTYLFSANPFVTKTTNLDQGFAMSESPWTARWRQSAMALVTRRIEGIPYVSLAQADSHFMIKDSGQLANQAFAEWLKRRSQPKEPFFACFNLMEAHWPRLPSQKEREPFLSPAEIQHSFKLHPQIRSKVNAIGHFEDLSAPDIKVIRGVYDASIRRLDSLLAEFLQILSAAGLPQETAIILVADHGENLGEHNLLDHRSSVYNTLLNVPLLIRYPARFPAGRVARPVNLIDLFPTILDIAHIPAPALPQEPWYSLCDGEKAHPAKRVLVSERLPPQKPDPNSDPRLYRSIEADAWKLIWADTGRHELYDLGPDQLETKNLWAEQPTRANQFLTQLNSWVEAAKNATGAPAKTIKPVDPEVIERIKALGYINH